MKLVAHFDNVSQVEWSLLVVLAWAFLLRVDSEAVPIQIGSPGDLQMLAPHRHSALVLEGDTIVLRL